MERAMNESVRRGYDRAAGRYAAARDQFKSRKYLDLLAERLRPGAVVLDVGCGSGVPIDSYLVERGCAVRGIDISAVQIEMARANIPEASYEVRDMSGLQDFEYAVDAIVSFYAIFHTPREAHLDLLHTFGTFLQPGGLLLVTMGASDWVGSDDDFYGVTMHWSHYAAATNRDLVAQAGFDIVFDEIDPAGDERHLVILASKP
jgi:cyclopropane fatty-acyl-phospholipid synthase-like methyltransferase